MRIAKKKYLAVKRTDRWAFFTSIVRGVVAISVYAFVLAHFLGMTGIWLAFPAAEFLTALIMVIAMRKGRTGVRSADRR